MPERTLPRIVDPGLDIPQNVGLGLVEAMIDAAATRPSCSSFRLGENILR
jgi:hypothetical protein